MTKAVEPYTDEELARGFLQWGQPDAPVTQEQARDLWESAKRLLATIEADREKLAEKDAHIAELEAKAAALPVLLDFAGDVSYAIWLGRLGWTSERWGSDKAGLDALVGDLKKSLERAEAAEARVSELEKDLHQAKGRYFDVMCAACGARIGDEETGKDCCDYVTHKRCAWNAPTPPEEEAK